MSFQNKKMAKEESSPLKYFPLVLLMGIVFSAILASGSTGKRCVTFLLSIAKVYASLKPSTDIIETYHRLAHRSIENDKSLSHKFAKTDSQLPHRGTFIGEKVKASELAKAYQSIKEEYGRLALNPSLKNHWQLLNSHPDGSEVSLLEHETDPYCPYVRMTSIMPGSIQDLWDFLSLDNWSETMPKMDPFYEGLSVLGEYRHEGIEMKLARKTLKRILAFGKRDFTFVSVSDQPQTDGMWVSGTVSVITDEFPRRPDYVRAFQDSIAFYEAMGNCKMTGQPRTKLTIVFRIDLNDSTEGGSGGYIPMWIYVKTVGSTGMLSVQNMKKQLQEVVDRKVTNEKGTAIENEINLCRRNWWEKLMNNDSNC